MSKSSRNLLVIFHHGSLDEQSIRQQAAALQSILHLLRSPENFCAAHELVNRNRITRRKKTILKETKHARLRPFRFLINLN